MNRLFRADQLSAADYVLAIAVTASCFALFLQVDITDTGWHSINYYFWKPLEFYEHCARGVLDGCVYQPPIYIIFAIWLYPYKLLGVITDPNSFPLYLSYWLKFLTSIVYIVSSIVFYRIALVYSPNRAWAKYATAAWLTAPLAVFSQFIFSQYDIFYVVLTLCGFLFFLRQRTILASVYFGAAITFKLFPAFVFVPLLLLYEKNVYRLAVRCLIFVAPTVFFSLLFASSPAYIEGVRSFAETDRIYEASLEILSSGYSRIYLLFVSFTILCGVTYFAEVPNEARTIVAAYVWLIGSILPFVLVLWNPQWVIFLAAPIAFTSIIDHRERNFQLLDLVGMFCFVATTSLTWENNVDAAMFRSEIFRAGGLASPGNEIFQGSFSNSYYMSELFNWFGDHSRNVFLSLFCGYLALQAILKRNFLSGGFPPINTQHYSYSAIRKRLYVGLLIFLLPASIAIYKGVIDRESVVENDIERPNEIVSGASIESSFVAKGKTVKQVSLFLYCSRRIGSDPRGVSSDKISLDLVDSRNLSLATAAKTIAASRELSWTEFNFRAVPLQMNSRYTLRVTSNSGRSGDAFLLGGVRVRFSGQ